MCLGIILINDVVYNDIIHRINEIAPPNLKVIWSRETSTYPTIYLKYAQQLILEFISFSIL